MSETSVGSDASKFDPTLLLDRRVIENLFSRAPARPTSCEMLTIICLLFSSGVAASVEDKLLTFETHLNVIDTKLDLVTKKLHDIESSVFWTRAFMLEFAQASAADDDARRKSVLEEHTIRFVQVAVEMMLNPQQDSSANTEDGDDDDDSEQSECDAECILKLILAARAERMESENGTSEASE